MATVLCVFPLSPSLVEVPLLYCQHIFDHILSAVLIYFFLFILTGILGIFMDYIFAQIFGSHCFMYTNVSFCFLQTRQNIWGEAKEAILAKQAIKTHLKSSYSAVCFVSAVLPLFLWSEPLCPVSISFLWLIC